MAEPRNTPTSTWALFALIAALLCVAALVIPSRWLLTPERSYSGLPPLHEQQAPPTPEPSAELEPAEVEPVLAPPAPLQAPPGALPQREPRVAVVPERSWPEHAPVAAPDVQRSEVQRVSGWRGADAGVRPSSARLMPADAGAPRVSSMPDPAPAEPTIEPEVEPAAAPEECGAVSCAAGYTCCDPSCGLCVAAGEVCDPSVCQSKIQFPFSASCGRNTCSVGEVCCNPSCGTCVEPGATCSQDPCD